MTEQIAPCGLACCICINHINHAVISHYDSLINENNDPVHDSEPLREYMNKWDGQAFLDELKLTSGKDVLEIGVGTGRLALRVCGSCKSFCGIDISPKTIERAQTNLSEYSNKTLICDDFMIHQFDRQFDIIYSSLTFMHLKDKQTAIHKVAELLSPDGRFVLSISKCQDTILDYGNRKIGLFPDKTELTNNYIKNSGLTIERQFETEFAVIIAAVKEGNG